MKIRTKRDQKSSAAFWVKGLLNALTQQGLDAAALFRAADLDLALLDDPDSRFPTEKVSLLWQLAVAQSSDPAVGLAVARVSQPASFGIVGFAMMSAPDLRRLLERMTRYSRIISEAATLSIAEDQEGCRLLFDLAGGPNGTPWQRDAFDLMSLLSFVRWVMVRDLRPLAVELTARANADIQPYQEAFGCPLRFEAPVNALLFSHADVERPLPTAQARLAGVHEQIAGEYLARMDRSEISLRVRNAIRERVSDGEPRRATIARVLGMSERTLQRRLEAEGSSYRQLLDDTQQELARQTMDRDDLSLADAAYVLGFNDQSSFFRAIKRWFGVTPRQYRLQRARAHRRAQ